MDQETIRQFMNSTIPFVTTYGMQVVGAVIILILGRFASRLGANLTRKALVRAKADAALVGFLGNAVGLAIMAFASAMCTCTRPVPADRCNLMQAA